MSDFDRYMRQYAKRTRVYESERLDLLVTLYGGEKLLSKVHHRLLVERNRERVSGKKHKRVRQKCSGK